MKEILGSNQRTLYFTWFPAKTHTSFELFLTFQTFGMTASEGKTSPSKSSLLLSVVGGLGMSHLLKRKVLVWLV